MHNSACLAVLTKLLASEQCLFGDGVVVPVYLCKDYFHSPKNNKPQNYGIYHIEAAVGGQGLSEHSARGSACCVWFERYSRCDICFLGGGSNRSHSDLASSFNGVTIRVCAAR